MSTRHSFTKKPQDTRRVAIFSALTGAAFCILAALGLLDTACVTSGCAVFKGTSFLGISLWWWGAACFFALAALIFAKCSPLARPLAATAVCIDIFLLGWMALTATCANCVIAGTLFALTFLCLYGGDIRKKTAPLLIGILWIAALTPNLVAIAQESVTPWAISGPTESPVRLYFSPSCPACRKALTDLEVNEGVSYVPVTKNRTDVLRMLVVTKALEDGKSLHDAVLLSDATEPDVDALSFSDAFSLRMKLFMNGMIFKRFGTHALPLMTTTGWYRNNDDSNAAHDATPDGQTPPASETGSATKPDTKTSMSSARAQKSLSAQPSATAQSSDSEAGHNATLNSAPDMTPGTAQKTVTEPSIGFDTKSEKKVPDTESPDGVMKDAKSAVKNGA